MVQYLDYRGLTRYDEKIKTHIHNEDIKRVLIEDRITEQDIDDIVSGLI
jgi:hypothetical protein